MSMLGPDDFCDICVGDLTDMEIDALEQVWPLAYEAVMALHEDIREGRCSPATSSLDLRLYTLVSESTPAL